MMMAGDPSVAIAAGGSVAAVGSFPAAGAGGAGFFRWGAGAPGDVPTEIVVADTDVDNVRLVTRRPNAR